MMKKYSILVLTFFCSIILSGCRQILNAQVGSPDPEETELTGQAFSAEITDIDRESGFADFEEILLDEQDSSSEDTYTWDNGF